jgi:hypothetical protein
MKIIKWKHYKTNTPQKDQGALMVYTNQLAMTTIQISIQVIQLMQLHISEIKATNEAKQPTS